MSTWRFSIEIRFYCIYDDQVLLHLFACFLKDFLFRDAIVALIKFTGFGRLLKSLWFSLCKKPSTHFIRCLMFNSFGIKRLGFYICLPYKVLH